MATSATSRNGTSESNTTRFARAVVIGAGIAGLTAAQVLAGYFDQVTLIERDNVPDPAGFRRGVPQTRHAHRLLPRGQIILERRFPGLVSELLAQGAVAVEPLKELSIGYDGVWHTGRPRPNWVSLSASRALLEATIYRRLSALSNVRLMQGYEVIGLQADDSVAQVTGVTIQCVRCQSTEVLPADLVVDASGRNSKAPRWLDELGYPAPEEWTIDPFVGYATRIYERPANFDGEWETLYVRPTPPYGTRGGIIVPMEGNRWHVTLVGVAEDYPPQDADGFLEFARSLPTPALYDTIKDARPLSKPAGYRLAANRIRRFDRLPRYLEGFLVFGDAATILNPIYAQGMTAAAIGSQVLEECTAEYVAGDLTGLSRAFQQRLNHALSRLWRSVISQDWHWSTTTVTDKADQIQLSQTASAPARIEIKRYGDADHLSRRTA